MQTHHERQQQPYGRQHTYHHYRTQRPAYEKTESFFFQAEDGIRYGHVTGVQTCALPISRDLETASRLGSRCALGASSGRRASSPETMSEGAGGGRVERAQRALQVEGRAKTDGPPQRQG